MDPAIETFLNTHYNAGPFRFEAQLPTNGLRLAYRVSGPTGQWVVKLTDPGRAEAVVAADVNTPAYLSGVGFPAPYPLAARDGRLFLPYEDRFIYMYEFIPGQHPRPSDAFYARLGALLGRLHSLPHACVPVSAYRPAEVLAGTRAAILRAEQSPLLPADQRAVIPDLLRLIDNMPSFEDLPCGIIHTDPYLVNLIETPSGSLALIDWEDAGISYPLLDVAYGAAHLCTFTARDRRMWGVPGPDEGLLWRPDWGKIFLTAYEAVRPLTPAERNLLPDAVRFSFLCYIPMWGVDEIILENYQRMQMVAPG